MRKLRVLVLVHEDFIAPKSREGLSDREIHRTKTEYDVLTALEELGHDVRQLGVTEELVPIRDLVASWRPHVVFNILEEFKGEALYDHNIVSYLELLGVPYTGCSPRGLVLARDKALAKKLVAYHRVSGPRFFVVERGRSPGRLRRLRFPLIVKSLVEEASMGIAKASVVHDEVKLAERVRFIHKNVQTDAIVEEFIPGREIYVAVLGNQRLQVLPPLELVIDARPEAEPLVATEKVKHDVRYQQKRGVRIVVADLAPELRKRIDRVSRRIYRILELRGYARIDFRLTEEGEIFFLEANPNPEIARDEEVAVAAASVGIAYPALIQKIVSLGLRAAARRGG